VQETYARALSTSHNSTDEVTYHSLTADPVISVPPHFEPWPLPPGRLYTSTISMQNGKSGTQCTSLEL